MSENYIGQRVWQICHYAASLSVSDTWTVDLIRDDFIRLVDSETGGTQIVEPDGKMPSLGGQGFAIFDGDHESLNQAMFAVPRLTPTQQEQFAEIMESFS